MRIPLTSVILVVALLSAACGGDQPPPAARSAAPAPGGEALTAFELEHGIGPVTEPVALGPVDRAEAELGEKLFETKCSACHKMEERYVGPALGEVTTRRSPAFILNMILAPEQMYGKHPVVKQLLAEHMTQMPNQGLTRADARQVLEYLRTQSHAEVGQ